MQNCSYTWWCYLCTSWSFHAILSSLGRLTADGLLCVKLLELELFNDKNCMTPTKQKYTDLMTDIDYIPKQMTPWLPIKMKEYDFPVLWLWCLCLETAILVMNIQLWSYMWKLFIVSNHSNLIFYCNISNKNLSKSSFQLVSSDVIGKLLL